MGAPNLTIAELVAVILGSGTKKRSVITIAEQLVKDIGSTLLQADVTKLEPYLGSTQATKLIAAIELGRRLSTQPVRRVISKPQDVLQEAEFIRGSHREHTIGLYLNARYELLKKVTLSIGTVNANALEPRDVFAPALALPCRSVILIHNHPSGTVEPSQDDVRVTERLQHAAELLGITILDHLIVTNREYFSFHQQKILATFD